MIFPPSVITLGLHQPRQQPREAHRHLAPDFRQQRLPHRLFGAATGRAEAHTIRLGLLYALLHGASEIELCHLEAALDLWRYSSESSRWVFGDSLGDPTADEMWSSPKIAPVA